MLERQPQSLSQTCFIFIYFLLLKSCEGATCLSVEKNLASRQLVSSVAASLQNRFVGAHPVPYFAACAILTNQNCE